MKLSCLALASITTILVAQDGWFEDVTKAAGIDFHHRDYRSGKFYYVETTGAGGGWIDYDADGDLDLYLVNGGPTRGAEASPAATNRLYENREGHFIDVTQRSGLGDVGIGMGFCIGDYDGDGLIDLFLTNYGPDRLYRNIGDGHFRDVTTEAGVAGSRWGTNCCFGDIDGDGDLDLYVANYVDFSYEKNPQCGNKTAQITSYCRPTVFDGLPDYLYINQGDGTFKDESAQRGIEQGADEKGFGAIMSDIDGDRDLDILVANDGTMNRLYVNDGSGRFEDQALMAGIGFNGAGAAEAGMGIDLGDVDGNGLMDLVMTHYAMETNTLYANHGDMFFEDATMKSGLADASRRPVGWGVQFIDFDRDGDLDMAVANGHVMDNVSQIDSTQSYPQANQLLRNNGAGRFEDVSSSAGAAFTQPFVSRGLAAGDWNNDGRIDLLVTNINDRINLLRNRSPDAHAWIGVRLIGPSENRFAIGARIRLLKDDRAVAIREVRSGGSFMCQSDLRAHFGLGDGKGAYKLAIDWPNGHTQSHGLTALNRYIDISYAAP